MFLKQNLHELLADIKKLRRWLERREVRPCRCSSESLRCAAEKSGESIDDKEFTTAPHLCPSARKTEPHGLSPEMWLVLLREAWPGDYDEPTELPPPMPRDRRLMKRENRLRTIQWRHRMGFKLHRTDDPWRIALDCEAVRRLADGSQTTISERSEQ